MPKRRSLAAFGWGALVLGAMSVAVTAPAAAGGPDPQQTPCTFPRLEIALVSARTVRAADGSLEERVRVRAQTFLGAGWLEQHTLALLDGGGRAIAGTTFRVEPTTPVDGQAPNRRDVVAVASARLPMPGEAAYDAQVVLPGQRGRRYAPYDLGTVTVDVRPG